MVWGLRDLNEIIIPHFSRYPLWDEKARQLDLFSKGCRLLQVGGQDKMEELVDLLYVSNASGKRRRVDKQDYLEKWLS